MDGVISYSTLYPIVITIIYLISILDNSFDDGSIYMDGVTKFLHKLVGRYKEEVNSLGETWTYSTYYSRFRVRTLLFILSCMFYFIMFN
jgi:hypothetical protein